MQPRTESVATILKNITLTNLKLVLWNSSSSTFSNILWFSDLLTQMGSSYNWKSLITSMTWFKSFLWPRFSLALALVAGLEGILKNVSYPPHPPSPIWSTWEVTWYGRRQITSKPYQKQVLGFLMDSFLTAEGISIFFLRKLLQRQIFWVAT